MAKNKPNLYNTVMKGLTIDEVIQDMEILLQKLKDSKKCDSCNKNNTLLKNLSFFVKILKNNQTTNRKKL